MPQGGSHADLTADLFHTGLMVAVQRQVGGVPCKADFQIKCRNIVRFSLWWQQTIFYRGFYEGGANLYTSGAQSKVRISM